MRICIPTATADGAGAPVYDHFGSAPFLTIYDEIENHVFAVDNRQKSHQHGQCNPVALIAGHNVDVVICRGMGLRAVEKLSQAGIRVYRGTQGTVEDLIVLLKQNLLEEMSSEGACEGHGCH